MTPIYDAHDIVEQAHAIRSAYLGELLRSSLKALQNVLLTHKGITHGHTSAA